MDANLETSGKSSSSLHDFEVTFVDELKTDRKLHRYFCLHRQHSNRNNNKNKNNKVLDAEPSDHGRVIQNISHTMEEIEQTRETQHQNQPGEPISNDPRQMMLQSHETPNEIIGNPNTAILYKGLTKEAVSNEGEAERGNDASLLAESFTNHSNQNINESAGHPPPGAYYPPPGGYPPPGAYPQPNRGPPPGGYYTPDGGYYYPPPPPPPPGRYPPPTPPPSGGYPPPQGGYPQPGYYAPPPHPHGGYYTQTYAQARPTSIQRMGDLKLEHELYSSESRHEFIKKVYATLFPMLLVAFGIVFAINFQPEAKEWVYNHQILLLPALILYIAAVYALSCCVGFFIGPNPCGIIWLFVLTISLGFIAAISCTRVANDIIIMAAILTFTLFIVLSLMAFLIPFDFTKWLWIVVIATILLFVAAIVGMIVYIFAPFDLKLFNVVICIGFAVLLCIFILIDTQMLMSGKRYSISNDMYLWAAGQLFVDVILLFYYLVEILNFFGEK